MSASSGRTMLLGTTALVPAPAPGSVEAVRLDRDARQMALTKAAAREAAADALARDRIDIAAGCTPGTPEHAEATKLREEARREREQATQAREDAETALAVGEARLADALEREANRTWAQRGRAAEIELDALTVEIADAVRALAPAGARVLAGLQRAHAFVRAHPEFGGRGSQLLVDLNLSLGNALASAWPKPLHYPPHRPEIPRADIAGRLRADLEAELRRARILPDHIDPTMPRARDAA